MAEVFYSRSWAAPPLPVDVAAAKRIAAFAVVTSLVFHIVVGFVLPYLTDAEPAPPTTTLTVELIPPPEETLPVPAAASPPSRVQPVRQPSPVLPPQVVEQPRVIEPPPPQPVVESRPVLEPLPVAPVEVVQPDVVVEKPATNVAVPETAVAPVVAAVVSPPAPAELASTLPTPVPLTDLTFVPGKSRAAITLVFPERMRRLGKEATVILNVLVDEHGKPRKITVVRSAGPAFDEAAIAALMASEFEPARIGTRAVAVLLRQEAKFKLR